MKKKYLSTLICIIIFQIYAYTQIGVNSTGNPPASSAMLDVSSTNKGFLPPRMTSAQRTAIASPAPGLIVFDTDSNQLYIFSNGNWQAIAAPTYPRLSTEEIDNIVSPQVGDLAYDLTFKCLKHFDGSKWNCTNQDPCNPLPSSMAWSAVGNGVAQSAFSIAVDGLGNVYVTGQFGGTTRFGSTNLTASGFSDIFIAKYTSSGILQWVQKAGGFGSDKASSIKVDANGNAYITGFYENTASFGTFSVTSAGSQDIFVAKYNSLGVPQWVKSAGGSGLDNGTSIVLDNLNNVYLAGFFSNTSFWGTNSLTSSGFTDIFLAKCDNVTGNFQFVDRAGGIGTDMCTSITTNASGKIFATGFFSNTATFGSTNLVSAGLNDIFIGVYSPASYIWISSSRIGGTGYDYASGIVASSFNQDMIYLTGSFENTVSFGASTLTSVGSSDVFIAKYFFPNSNSLSSNVWSVRAGGIGRDESNGLVADAAANVYATGYFEQIADFDATRLSNKGLRDIFTVKYDSNGNYNWAQKNGGIGFDTGNAITVDGMNNIYISGGFMQTICFGSDVLSGSNVQNIFVARLKE